MVFISSENIKLGNAGWLKGLDLLIKLTLISYLPETFIMKNLV